MASRSLTAAGPSRRWVALGVVCVGQLMLTLDTTIVNTALPAIQDDLGFSASALTWVPNAYLVALGSFLLLGGRLGDLWGRKPMFLAGLTIFTAASMACGLAGSPEMLAVARFAQGIGAAVTAATVLALIVAEFPDARGRATATSVYTFISIAGGSLGLLLGGWLTETLDWHWIFFINLPVGLAAFAVGRATLEHTPATGPRRKVDWAGGALVTLACLAGITAIVRSEDVGAGSWQTIGLLLIAVALLAAFLLVERRVADPILPRRVVRVGSLVVVSAVRGLLVLGNYAAFFLGTLYLQEVHGFSPLESGLSFLPQTLVVAALSLGPAAWLAHRVGLFPVLLVGLTATAAGVALLAVFVDPDGSYFPGFPLALALMGVGIGTAFIASIQLGLSDVPPEDAGIASGFINMAMQLGAAIGVALLGTVAASRTSALQRDGESLVDALCGGYRLGLAIGAALIVVALVAAILLLRPRPAVAVERSVP